MTAKFRHTSIVALLLTLAVPVGLYSGQSATVIYLVRHAEKASETERDPLLNDAGKARAACLANTLGDSWIQAIYTTEFHRTQDTATPLATRLKIEPQTVPGGKMDELVEKLRAETGRNVLVIGHSNTVPKIIEKLGAGSATIGDQEYDRMFIVTLNGNGSQVSMTSLRYCISKP